MHVNNVKDYVKIIINKILIFFVIVIGNNYVNIIIFIGRLVISVKDYVNKIIYKILNNFVIVNHNVHINIIIINLV